MNFLGQAHVATDLVFGQLNAGPREHELERARGGQAPEVHGGPRPIQYQSPQLACVNGFGREPRVQTFHGERVLEQIASSADINQLAGSPSDAPDERPANEDRPFW